MRVPIKQVTVKVTTYGRLEYSGPIGWDIPTEGKDTISFNLDVVVPPNDTSGIKVDIWHNADAQYFVTTGDTMEIYHSWPQPPQPKELQTTFYEMGGGMHRVPGSEIPPWKRPPQDSTLKVLMPVSAAGTDSSIIMKPEGKVDTLAGKTVLPQPNINSKVVDSAGWSTIDGLKEAAQKDIEKERDKKRELIVDLRKPEDYNYVRTLATELIPCDTAGYYRVKLTHAQANDVHNRGISITSARPPRGPHPAPKGIDQTPGQKDSSQKDGDGANGLESKMGQWVLRYEESFESGLYPYWGSTDFESDGGLDYWDTISTSAAWGEASYGSHSVWCSRIGQKPVYDQYDNYMTSPLYSQYAGFSEDWIAVEFDIWHIIEDSTNPGGLYDACALYYSFDGSSWARASDYYYGNSWGWCYDQYYEINLAGHSEFYLAFFFFSNNLNTYRGAFIDDFRLYVYDTRLPT
ncbi:MAG: hypothetical protein PHR28_10240 [candidate division Zixibacteria bacterium]|nr:hypothetical protein [candidate division Zixibacteria bacterium]